MQSCGFDIKTYFYNVMRYAITKICSPFKARTIYVNTIVLGIGKRDGIRSLEGLVTYLIVADNKYIVSTYRINQLGYIKNLMVWAIKNGYFENISVIIFCDLQKTLNAIMFSSTYQEPQFLRSFIY